MNHGQQLAASPLFQQPARVMGWKIEDKNLKSYYSYEPVMKILSVTKIVENDFTATSVFACK